MKFYGKKKWIFTPQSYNSKLNPKQKRKQFPHHGIAITAEQAVTEPQASLREVQSYA